MRRIRILGTGKYLPDHIVTAEEIDVKLNVRPGTAKKISGVEIRHYAQGESSSQMAAKAIRLALEDACLQIEDIDCIIGASGSMEQPIPCNAALIQEALGLLDCGIPAFDINSTCLSFVTALDTISYLVESGRYERVLLVSSEIASIALNPEEIKNYSLFGDGAVAVVIGKSKEDESSHIISSKMVTYSRGAHLSEVLGGGTKLHPREHNKDTEKNFLFSMEGVKLFELVFHKMDAFMEALFQSTTLCLEDIKMVIPHQASKSGMEHMRRKLGIPKEKFMSIVHNHGNIIAASIPMAFHEAIQQGKIKRGDLVLFIGTSAGLSIGGIILEY